MKTLTLALALALTSFVALAQPTTVEFSESVCNGGGGVWKTPVTVSSDICQSTPKSEIIIYEAGHCNGRRESAIRCEDGKISGFELLECICD